MNLKTLTASFGCKNLQDIVGRSDLLEQTRGLERIESYQLLLSTLEIRTTCS